jgi:hypothetical protein
VPGRQTEHELRPRPGKQIATEQAAALVEAVRVVVNPEGQGVQAENDTASEYVPSGQAAQLDELPPPYPAVQPRTLGAQKPAKQYPPEHCVLSAFMPGREQEPVLGLHTPGVWHGAEGVGHTTPMHLSCTHSEAPQPTVVMPPGHIRQSA